MICSTTERTPSSESTAPRTISLYMAWKRATSSAMNRVSPLALASATAASRPSPRSRIVSIIPGMEIGAPERTETNRGIGPLPKVLPDRSSSTASWASTSSASPSGIAPSAR